MSFEKIDINWAEQTFPTIFHVFGEKGLKKQIEGFNEVISKSKYSFSEYYVYVNLMKKRNISNPHYTILNILSALHSAKYSNIPLCAAIFHLEEILSESVETGAKIKGFRDLLISPGSFLSLIAELDIAIKLKRFCGNISLHNETDKCSNKNYDIHCKIDNIELDADVKWFKNSLIKERGLNPVSVFESLLKDDIRHFTIIKIKRHLFKQEDAISAALEVLEMYKHKDDLQNSDYSITVDKIGKYVTHVDPEDKFI